MKNFVTAVCLFIFMQGFASEEATLVSSFSFDQNSETFSPNPRLTLSPRQVSKTITLDGRIDSCYDSSACFGNFTEYIPIENRKPLAGTKGFLAYDQNYLYVAFVCEDPDIAQLRANFSDRDQMFLDDWVCITIDPNQDQQMAYRLYVNPRGVQGDRLWQAGTDEDASFDVVFQSEARIEERGWTAEMKIPFESLRFPRQPHQQWAVHFTRYYPRENEYVFSWIPVSKNNSSLMAQAGTLDFTFQKVEKEKRTFELLPYTIATQNADRTFNSTTGSMENWRYDDLEKRAGIGLKYGLTSNLTADITYNPDFSQIESDAGQVSVNNPFALFYDEKRPFFQEGSDIYTVDQFSRGIVLDQFINLFYSRSINDPLVAGKLSGKIGKVALGFTSAMDKNTPYIIPLEESSLVLPTNKDSYNNIIRAKYDLGNQSSIGLFLSDRHLKTSGSNTVAAVDGRFRLSTRLVVSTILGISNTNEPDDPALAAYMGGRTFEANGSEKTIAFDGEDFTGTLMRLKSTYESRSWFGSFAFQDFSPGFRAENGFISTNSHRNFEAVTGYTSRFETHPFLTTIEYRANAWRKFNYDGIVMDTGFRPNVVFVLKGQTVVQFAGFIFNREHLKGKQFGDARQAWVFVSNRMFQSVTGWVYLNMGREINRFGIIGHARNPFELAPSRTFNLSVSVKPGAKLQNDMELDTYSMWLDWGKDKIRAQKIVRDVMTYQFSRNLLIRLIGEYNWVDYYDASIENMVHQKYFTFEPLISYKLNALSVFYLGAHWGARTNFYTNWDNLEFNNQSVYLKFQYLFRI